jgi:putative nucleotidyltransferase with HDIG domain
MKHVALETITAGALAGLQQSISLLSAAHGYRDQFTRDHQHRVAALATAIGGRLGLAGLRLEVLRLAAIVHDVGKIALPAETLGKPGALSDVEYALVKEHSVIGFNILKNINAPVPVAEIAYQHHERLDGSGYPRRLAGAEILLEARIIAAADMFDAMVSNRAYRPGLPRDFVLGEMFAMAGRQLDADVVAACRDIVLSARAASAAPGEVESSSSGAAA